MEPLNLPPSPDHSEKPVPETGESLSQLRATRDAALYAAQTAIRDTTRLTRLLTILADQAPLEQLLDHVLLTLSELFSADIVVLLDPVDCGTYAPLAAIGLPEDLIHEPFSNAEESYTVAAMNWQAPIQREHLEADSRVDFQLKELGAKTGVWLPVISNLTARGVLILIRCQPIPFTHAEVGLLSAMTYRLGLSLEQSQKSLQLQAALAEVNRLNAELEQRVADRTQELRRAKEVAEAANLAKAAFLSIMGHELRTPLNSIFLAAEMLRDAKSDTAELHELSDGLQASSRRLLHMLEGVLEYAKAEVRPNATPLDVAAALQEVAVRFESRAARKQLALSFHILPDLPPICFDAQQFDRVMRRLLENALTYTPEGGRVTVTAEPVTNRPDLRGAPAGLRISVADTGVGLKAEDCERIFEPFVQVEVSYLQHSEGAGLGLTLARRQVELHGGQLWAESEGVGKGSLFTLIMPACQTAGPSHLRS